MKRLAIFLSLLLMALAALLTWIGEISVSGPRRLAVEALLSDALGTSIRFDSVTVRFAPLSLAATNLFIGERGMFEVSGLQARLLALASLREGRPVLALTVDTPMIDLTQISDAEEEEEEAEELRRKESASITAVEENPLASIPPLRVSKLIIRSLHLRFRMAEDDPVDVVIDSAEVSVHRPFLRYALEGSLVAKGGGWHRQQFGFRVDQLDAVGGVDEDGVWVEHTAIDGPDLHIRADATTTRHRQQAEATFHPALLGAFVDELALLGGSAHLQGTISGDVLDPEVDAQLTLTKASLAEHPIGDLTTRFVRARSRLSFDDVHVQSDVGRAHGTVQLVAYDEVPIQADLTWESIDLAKLLAVLGNEVPFHNLLDGQTVLRGMFDPFELHIQGHGSAQPVEAERAAHEGQWTASARILEDDFRAQVVVRQGDNRIHSNLLIRPGLFQGKVAADVADLNALSGLLPQPLAGLEVGGRGTVSAEFSGSADEPIIQGSLAMEDASLSGTALRALHGPVRIAKGILHTTGVQFATGGGTGALHGDVALSETAPNDWKLALHGIDTDLVSSVAAKVLEAPLPIHGGALDADVSCKGVWQKAALHANVGAKNVRIVDEPFAAVDVQLTAPLPSWTGNARLRHSDKEVLTLQATGSGAQTVDLSVSSTPFQVGRIANLGSPGLRGTATLAGRIFGPWGQTAGKLELLATKLGSGQQQWGDLRVTADGRLGRWNVQAAALEELLRAGVGLQAWPPFAYTLDLKSTEADLSPVIFDGNGAQLLVSGELRLAGELSDILKPSGSGRVSRFRLIRDEHLVEQASPFLFDIASGLLHIRTMPLQYEGGRLDIKGELSTSGSMHLLAHGQGDLVLLELFDLPLVAARGPFWVRGGATFSPGAGWRLEGEGGVQDGMLDFGLPVAFTRVNGNLVLQEDAIRIGQLEARAGGGRFEVAGAILLDDGPRLEWRARDVGFSAADGFEIKASGAGKLDGPWENAELSGSVEIIKALYDRNFEWADILPLLLDQLSGRKLPQIRSVETPIRLDLIIYSRGGVFVDNNLANLETWLDLLIGGNTSQPIISGRIGFLAGEVFLRGRKFSITGGTVDFRDYYRNDPILNITAEGRVVNSESDYGLAMVVSGSASNPRIQFSSSDPTLSQADVFNLATFGKTSAQLQREGSGVSAADALALVPTGEVEKRVGALVGFDRFEVEAVQSRSTGALEPRVTIGKDLTDRIRALAWSSFGVESRRAVQLEYRMSRSVSLLGSWESDAGSQAGAFGGDIKFRYEFRKVPFSLLNPYRYVER